MSCNCEGNVYNIGMGCCKPVVANPNAYYTKSEIDKKIDDIEVSGITEEKAQEMIDDSLADYVSKEELEGYATEEWVNDQGFLKEHQSLDNYYTKSETDGFLSDLEASDGIISGMVNNLSTMLEREAQRAQNAESQINENISNLSGNVVDLSETVQNIEDELMGDYASKEWVSGFTYDKVTIENMIEEGGGFVPENYYDKAATDALLVKKANTATTYTKTNVNSLLAKKADTATTYTKDDINAFMDTLETTDSVLDGRIDTLTTDLETETQRAQNAEAAISGAIPSLVGYATEAFVSGYTYDKSTIDEKIEEGGGFIPENYYDKTATDALLAAKADTASTYTKSEVDDLIPDISGKQDISGMTAYTTTSTTNVLHNTVTAHTADTNVHVTASEKASWNNKSDFSGDYNDLTNKPTIPSYTAGSGITISNNVISAKIWRGTQAEYDALINKDSDTIYLIYEE